MNTIFLHAYHIVISTLQTHTFADMPHLLFTCQCELPASANRPKGFCHLKISFSKFQPSFAPFVSECPLFPSPGGGNRFILNVRTAPGSEYYYHNLGCQKAIRIHWVVHRGSLGDSHWLVHYSVQARKMICTGF